MGDGSNRQSRLAQLATRIASGDRGAEGEVMSLLARPLRLLFRARKAPKGDVDDLVQETLLIVLRRLREGAIEDPETLGAYAAATASNVWIALQRRQGRQRQIGVEYAELLEPQAELPPEATLTQAQIRSAVRECIDGLRKARDRDVLRGYYLNEVDKPDLCERLGISSVHFDRVLFNARERLAKAFRRFRQGDRELD